MYKPLKTYAMTEEEIQQQIDDIILVSREVNKSKETARQFLIDAGIIKDKKKAKSGSKKK
jgi:hypothetical protein